MTPKEKAIYLVDKFQVDALLSRYEACKCAKIALDELSELARHIEDYDLADYFDKVLWEVYEIMNNN